MKERCVGDAPGDQTVTIAILPGPSGAEFDRGELYLPVGATTVWVNKTETAQVILPDMEGTRRVMRLAPVGQEGAVWMMQLRSSRQPWKAGGVYRWRLQCNEAACITIVTGGEQESVRV
jgi:hypothetical protein